MAYLLKMSVENSSRIYLRTTDDEIIAEELRPYNVLFFHEEDILVADKASSPCCTLAERIKQRIPELNTYFVESSAVQVNANDPTALSLAAQSRAQYYQEHTHDENEAWFFQHGQAAFYLRLREYVYMPSYALRVILSVFREKPGIGLMRGLSPLLAGCAFI
ncbi:hypothetical protein O1Q98_07840 [Dickeya lacustris]|uniref:Uncharacterized protein n=1 Tax=Dickeya lacustris TaxID=2259638 RepID=A0ABY8GB23_9GAMM|nr:hypothetical protein [Dickeya lacustris]WFN57115.1 hypothetical protein O1Q98_07840 [Dickeya lacustris]